MAQNSGIMGTVKSYIPGMSTEEHHKKTSAEDHESHDVSNTYQGQDAAAAEDQSTGGGILSYIPGFGGGSASNNQAAGVDSGTNAAGDVDGSAPHTRSGTVYGKAGDDDYNNSTPYDSSNTRTSVGGNKYGGDSDNDPVDTDAGYGAGKTGYTANDDSYAGNTGSQYGAGAGTGKGSGYSAGTNTGTGVGRSSHGPSTGGTLTDSTRPGTDYTTTEGSGGHAYAKGEPGSGTTGHYDRDSSNPHRETGATSYGDSETNYGTGATGGGAYDTNPTGGSTYDGNDSAYGGNNRTGGSAYGGSGSAYGGSNPTGGSAYGGSNPTGGSGYGGSNQTGGSAYGGSGSAYDGNNGGSGSAYGGNTGAGVHGGTGGVGQSNVGDYDSGRNTTGADNGVKGTPIEGDNVKGYAVSAPVGTGDVSKLNLGGEPSGQISGAHMEYGPTGTDSRDATGRGTVGNTTGEGDSSFANVKRNTGTGTEHVVAQSSSSRIQHSSVTQM